MAWFRFYDEVLDDPKVQQLPAEIFRKWVNLLCLAKRNNGALPCLADTAFALRLSEPDTSELLIYIKELGLLDVTETGMEPHNWKRRQYKSDVSTERVKRFRKRRETVSENDIETPRARQNRPDTEKKERQLKLSSSKSKSINAEFDDWWPLVPKKVGKGEALRKFKIARQKTDLQTLRAGTIRWAQEAADKDPQFICQPAKWLHHERWLDEPERKLHGNQHRGNGARRPSPHDTLLAAGAWAATSRPERSEAIATEPDGNGDGDTEEPAPGVPHIP